MPTPTDHSQHTETVDLNFVNNAAIKFLVVRDFTEVLGNWASAAHGIKQAYHAKRAIAHRKKLGKVVALHKRLQKPANDPAWRQTRVARRKVAQAFDKHYGKAALHTVKAKVSGEKAKATLGRTASQLSKRSKAKAHLQKHRATKGGDHKQKFRSTLKASKPASVLAHRANVRGEPLQRPTVHAQPAAEPRKASRKKKGRSKRQRPRTGHMTAKGARRMIARVLKKGRES